LAIVFSPKVGQVLECDFGNYGSAKDLAGRQVRDPNGHIPPEMVKNRLVVVLNGKIGGGCIVVPLSTTHDPAKSAKGLHVLVPAASIEDLIFFKQGDRWAKADMVQQVSKERLNRPRSQRRGFAEVHLSHDMVADIQKAVIKAINASSLLA
jgi:uncharacterized protein YifN (PemK superfamily)